eukprot:IDg6247t1
MVQEAYRATPMHLDVNNEFHDFDLAWILYPKPVNIAKEMMQERYGLEPMQLNVIYWQDVRLDLDDTVSSGLAQLRAKESDANG